MAIFNYQWIFNCQWVPAPIGTYYGGGQRWVLMRGTHVEGSVVLPISGGYWEAYAGPGDTLLSVSGGHDSIGKAARALLRHLEQKRQKPGEPLTAKLGDFLQLKIVR